MARIEFVKAWRTALALPNPDIEPAGGPYVGITFQTYSDEYMIPFSVESARTLADELESLCREAEAQRN